MSMQLHTLESLINVQSYKNFNTFIKMQRNVGFGNPLKINNCVFTFIRSSRRPRGHSRIPNKRAELQKLQYFYEEAKKCRF